jgi:hypothetical protein
MASRSSFSSSSFSASPFSTSRVSALSAVILAVSVSGAFVACAAPTDDEISASDDAELRALSPAEIVGTLAYGQTSAPVAYTKTPLYRAFRFDGIKGDAINAWVRSNDGDARAWLLADSFATITSNLDAAPGNKDAHLEATLPRSGTYYVVFRETARKNAAFTVSLDKAGGGCALAPAITPKWEAGAAGRPSGPMIFDAARNRFVVFSKDGTSELVAGGWSPPSGDPLPPGVRSEAAIAYDSDRGRAVLFGGSDAGNALLGDTWEWDGATEKWAQITPAGFTPRARRGHALVYDAARKKTVLYGGIAGTQVQDYMEDTWTWDGAAWTRVGNAQSPHPEPRTGLHMAFDASRGRVVLYGQYGNWYVGPIGSANSSNGNTWEWDGSGWTLAPEGGGSFSSDDPTSLPMGYDTRRGHVVRFDMEGGRYRKTFIVREWNGTAWSTVSAGAGPSVDIASATQYYGSYDPNRGRFVLGSTGYDWKTEEFFYYEEPNRAPVLGAIADQRVFAGDTLAFAIGATDADGNAIRYDVTPLPAGATLDPQLGAFRWTPTAAEAGSYTLTAKATDGCADAQRTFTIKVDDIGYAALPNGAVKLGGTVKVPVYLYQPSRTYEAWPELACVVSGQNPGKVTVSCGGGATTGSAYPGYSTSFTPTTMTVPLEQDLSFSSRTGSGDALQAFAGRLEALSDGTYKLHVTAWAQPIAGAGTPGPHAAMRTDGPYGTTDAYGVVDVIP